MNVRRCAIALVFSALANLTAAPSARALWVAVDTETSTDDSAGDAALALIPVEIGASSSSEIVVEREERAPPPTTPEDLARPRQSSK